MIAWLYLGAGNAVAAGDDPFVAGASAAGRRDYVIRTWDTTDGLPMNSATSMVQDDAGFLWFGTFNGLVRFDGVRFEVFDPSNTPELPDPGIVNLHLDRSGRMWISTLGGLVTRQGDRWRSITGDDGWHGDVVRTFAERSDGALLMTSFDARAFVWSDERFVELPQPPGYPTAIHGAVDAADRWWAYREGFQGTWDGTGWRGLDGLAPADAGMGLVAARDGGVWLIVGETIHKHRDGELVLSLTVPGLPRGIWQIFEDSDGNLWISTHDAGLHRVDPAGTLATWDRRSGLESDGVRFVFEDRERTLWIGVEGGGLVRFRRRRVHAFAEESGVAERVVRTVAPRTDGSLLVGTYGGGAFTLDGATAERIAFAAEPDAPRYIQSILEDRAGRVWIGAFADGLFTVDADGARRVPLPSECGANVIALFEDSIGRLWVSGGDSIAMVESGVASVPAAIAGEPIAGVVAFAEDRDGRIVLTNEQGVHRLDPRAGATDGIEPLRTPDGSPITGVVSLRIESDGTIWMGTLATGLMRWRGDRLVVIDRRHGLPANSVRGILDDTSGHWWLATDAGIVRISRTDLEAIADGRARRGRWILLGVEDGMLAAQCSGRRQPVCGSDVTGRLWFATPRGVAMVDPSSFRSNDLPPPLLIESVGYFKAGSAEGMEPRGLELRDFTEGSVVLPPGVGRMEIRYTALSLSNPSAMRFEVMMEGLDPRWRDVGTVRSVAYYAPPPGTYRFRMRATNNDGVWSNDVATAAITIEPFLWQTRWFVLTVAAIMVAVSVGGAWWAAHARYSRHRRNEERFQRVVEAAPNAMIMVDEEGRITLVNEQAEREFGYGRSELIGRSIEMLVAEPLRGEHAALRREFTAQSTTNAMAAGRELTGLRKDGTQIPLEVGLAPIRTERGTSVLASIVNVTERRERERERIVARNELAHLSRVAVLGELSGALAHELNQPLTAILSNAQAAQRLLRRDDVDMQEILDILGDIVQQDKRAGEVIRRLRAMLRKGETELEPVRLDELVEEAIRLLHGELVAHDVNARLEIEPHLPLVRGDRVQIQQVIVNLIMNAVEAMRDGDRGAASIRVSASATDGHVTVSVRDAGPGVPAESLDRLFEPFYTTKSGGLGLGLAICRSIITAHSGEITGGNHSEGGAEIRFTLPTIGERSAGLATDVPK